MSKNNISFNYEVSQNENFQQIANINFLFNRQKSQQINADKIVALILNFGFKDFSQEQQEKFYYFLKKMFREEKRLLPIPQFILYSLQKDHVDIRVQKENQQVKIIIQPGSQFENLASEFLSTLKNSGLRELIDSKQHLIQIKIESGQSFQKTLIEYCKDSSSQNLAYFLLKEKKVQVSVDKNQQVNVILDKCLKVLFDDYDFSYLSSGLEYDIQRDYQFYNAEEKIMLWDNRDPNPIVLQYLENIIEYCIDYFQAFSKVELKNTLKIIKFFQSINLHDQIKLQLSLSGLLMAETNIDLNFILTLVEFLAMHPKTEKKTQVTKYKKKYLEYKNLNNNQFNDQEKCHNVQKKLEF